VLKGERSGWGILRRAHHVETGKRGERKKIKNLGPAKLREKRARLDRRKNECKGKRE
jgi:hypothetical protein